MKSLFVSLIIIFSATSGYAQLGAQKTIAIVLNPNDGTLGNTRPVIANANAILDRISNHRSSIVGIKDSLVDAIVANVNYNTTPGCDTVNAKALGEQAATSQGYNIASYDKEMILMNDPGCQGFIGLTINSKVMYFQSWFDQGLVLHELGHSFGLQHANAFNCDKVTLLNNPLTTCNIWSQGNPIDPMGKGDSDYNAESKRRIWGDSVPLITVDGDYTIFPLDDGILSIREGIKIALSSTISLILEYRPASVDKGVIVNWHNSVDNQDYLLDMTPGENYYGNAGLPLGNTWTDPITGITIRHVSSDSRQATIRISNLAQLPFTLTWASPITVTSADGNPIPVNYPSPTITGGTPPINTVCNPVSGSLFPVGNTSATCTATDNTNRTATGTLLITVLAPHPVDCIVGPWVNTTIDTTTSAIVTNGNVQTRTVTTIAQQSRTIYQQPSGGGLACPVN